MFRITTDEDTQTLALRLEGRLEGPWIKVLAHCFSHSLSKLKGRRLCVDLNGLTFVDAKGKAHLAEMYAQGAELIGDDLETKAIVSEIQGSRVAGGNGESKQATSHPVVSVGDELAQLQRLQAELHEVNEEFAKAALPLERVSEMNEEQREKVAVDLRARLARWDSVTQQIAQVMGTGSATLQGTPKDNEGESR